MGQLTKDEWSKLMDERESEDWDMRVERGKLYCDGLKAREAKKMQDVANDAQQDETGLRIERGAVLDEAKRVINGMRQDAYGNPEDSFALIASYWSVYTGVVFTASDVAMMMTLMKVAREQNGAGKHDNVVDACGYLALYEDMRGTL